MKVRIIMSDECPHCVKYGPRLTAQGFQYERYDADDPNNKEQLDKWNISDLPVVQIVGEDGSLLWQFPFGMYSPDSIRIQMQILQQQGKV